MGFPESLQYSLHLAEVAFPEAPGILRARKTTGRVFLRFDWQTWIGYELGGNQDFKPKIWNQIWFF